MSSTRPAFARQLGVVLVLALAGCAEQPPPPPKTPAAPPATAPVAAPAPPGPVTGAPLVLIPAPEARPLAQALVTIPSLDRALTAASGLARRAMPVAMDPAAVRDMLLDQLGIPADASAELDLASPVGIVFVSLGPRRGTGVVFAMSAKGPAQAERAIAAIGTVVTRRPPAVEIRARGGGRGWAVINGRTIVLSDSAETLALGGNLAVAAQLTPSTDAITATVFPDAIARAQGTDVKQALTKAIADARAAQAENAAAGKTARSLEMLEDILTYVMDAEAIDLRVTIDETRGLAVAASFRPRPGTGLEKIARDVRPFEVDPVLFGDRPPALLFASSYGPFAREQFEKQRKRLQASSDRGARAALGVFDTAFAESTGQWSGGGRLFPTPSVEVVYPLKDRAGAAKVASALARLDAPAALALWRAELGPNAGELEWTFKRERVGRLAALRYSWTPTQASSPIERDSMVKLLGAPRLDAYVAVAGTRLVAVAGKDAKARLQAIAAGKTGAASGSLADALAATRASDGFWYLDLAPVLALVGSVADDPRAKIFASGAAAAAVPMYGTTQGDQQGRALTFDLRIPASSFSGFGTILQSLGGAPQEQ